ncbi:MAG: hypothetical protein AAF438_23180, partial [Pseudomonadota bacterium]
SSDLGRGYFSTTNGAITEKIVLQYLETTSPIPPTQVGSRSVIVRRPIAVQNEARKICLFSSLPVE